MSSSIAGLHAIASKPGQSFAPMIGWFVLRSAGYSAYVESTVTVTSPLPKGGAASAEEAIPREYGEQAAAVDEHEAVGMQGEKGDVFGALLQLLIFLPGTVGLVQLGLWQAYRLHGVVLGTICAPPLPLMSRRS